jgi:hypothetical protein
VILEIGVGHHVDGVSVAFRPLEERQLPVRPSGRACVRRQVIELQVADVGRHLRVGRRGGRDPATVTRRLVQVARRHRTLQRHASAAGVEVPAAEVVVGMPRVRRQRKEHRRGRCADRGAHDEEGMAASLFAVDVDLEDDFVVARAPCDVDVDEKRGRPRATVAGGIRRGGVAVRGDGVVRADDDALRPDASDLDRHRQSPGRRHVHSDRPATNDRLRPAVRRDRLVCHRRKLFRQPRAGQPGAGVPQMAH